MNATDLALLCPCLMDVILVLYVAFFIFVLLACYHIIHFISASIRAIFFLPAAHESYNEMAARLKRQNAAVTQRRLNRARKCTPEGGRVPYAYADVYETDWLEFTVLPALPTALPAQMQSPAVPDCCTVTISTPPKCDMRSHNFP